MSTAATFPIIVNANTNAVATAVAREVALHGPILDKFGAGMLGF